MGPGGPPGGGGGAPGLFGGFCNMISSCLNMLCCCWLFQDCFGGPMGPPGGPPGPPGPFAGAICAVASNKTPLVGAHLLVLPANLEFGSPEPFVPPPARSVLCAICLSFLCCCWLLQDCFGGPMGLPGGPPGPPGPFGGLPPP
ncbi:hypothetical protein LWI28_009028 [Acer negundo]|uniref:Uncharacterized protein n=1 Tax=Acer negundo TaxID=4023 RepID=A0AAD5J4S6_ACENE|nr:hypothetical protein LWI28_009028 [Acer negundo]